MSFKIKDGVRIELTSEEIAQREADAAEASIPRVPQLIEMRKAKLQMLEVLWPNPNDPQDMAYTLLDAMEATAAAGGRVLQIELEGAHLSRTCELVVGLQVQFGITDQQMDAIFTTAGTRS